MCSTRAQRIAEIGQAIEDLAAQARAVYARPGPQRPASVELSERDATGHGAAAISAADQVAIRLAELWTLLADLDPDMASRLPGYQA
jgi:hypothetical protein